MATDLEPPDVSIEKLAALGDEDLARILGYTDKLNEAKEAIKDMQALTGKARESAEERLQKMFSPNIYGDELKWIVSDAKREAKTGKEEADCCCPTSIL